MFTVRKVIRKYAPTGISSKKFYKTLLGIFLAIGIIPSLLIGIFSSTIVDNIIRRRLIQEAEKATDSAIVSIDSLLDKYVFTLNELCTDSLLPVFLSNQNTNENTVQKIYEKMYRMLSELDNSADIHIICSNFDKAISLKKLPDMYKLENNKNWGVFRAANGSKHAEVYPTVYTHPDHIKMAASVISAVRTEKGISGYIAIDIPMEVLKKSIIATDDILAMNFSLMTHNYYLLFNDAELETQTHFITWPHREYTHQKGYVLKHSNNKELLYTYSPSRKYNFIIISALNISLIIGNLSIASYILSVTALIIIAISIIVSFIISKHINKPLQKIVFAMQAVESGDFNRKITIKANNEFGYLAKQFNIMCEKINVLFKNDREKQERLRLSELKNLQSQIHPHFFYNTLDSIKWLAKLNNQQEIYIMVNNLNHILKTGMRVSEEFITIEESLKNLNAYIAIQKIRFADKFSVKIDIVQELLGYRTPALILQPLVENAMIHGLEPKPDTGNLTIEGLIRKNTVIFRVEDDGVGIPDKKLKEIRKSIGSDRTGEKHIGLKNIDKRIKLYYGTRYGLSINKRNGCGTVVTIKLPYIPIVQENT